MTAALIVLFLVFSSTAVFVIAVFRKEIFLSWRVKKDAEWTTYYRSGCMHLVPLEGQFHSIETDGDCQCHTRVDQFGTTKLYSHQRLRV